MNRELTKELLNIDLSASGWTIESINYQSDLNDIKHILYQILLLLFVYVFFNLTWIFYTFYNDIIWKK
jgi:ABC-type lipoprotein release transport system permease subunit